MTYRPKNPQTDGISLSPEMRLLLRCRDTTSTIEALRDWTQQEWNQRCDRANSRAIDPQISGSRDISHVQNHRED